MRRNLVKFQLNSERKKNTSGAILLLFVTLTPQKPLQHSFALMSYIKTPPPVLLVSLGSFIVEMLGAMLFSLTVTVISDKRSLMTGSIITLVLDIDGQKGLWIWIFFSGSASF